MLISTMLIPTTFILKYMCVNFKQKTGKVKEQNLNQHIQLTNQFHKKDQFKMLKQLMLKEENSNGMLVISLIKVEISLLLIIKK